MQAPQSSSQPTLIFDNKLYWAAYICGVLLLLTITYNAVSSSSAIDPDTCKFKCVIKDRCGTQEECDDELQIQMLLWITLGIGAVILCLSLNQFMCQKSSSNQRLQDQDELAQ